MQMKIARLAAAAGAVALFWAGAACAAGPDSERVATVNWVNNRHNEAVIDDRTYVLAPTMTVHGPRGVESRTSLRDGMHVRMRTVPGRLPSVVELWIVP